MDRQLQYAFSDRADIRRKNYIRQELYESLPYSSRCELVSSYPYISPYTYLSELATHIIPTVIDTPYAIGLKPIATEYNIDHDSIIYCSNWPSSRAYLQQILKKSRKSVFIIFSHSDESVDNSYSEFIDYLNVKHIFAQNCTNLDSKNFTPIPIGIEGKHIKTHGRLSNSQYLLQKFTSNRLDHSSRDNAIVGSFSLSTNIEERKQCLLAALQHDDLLLHDCTQIKNETTSPMHSFYRQLSQSKFALCPSGNGFDTHRFWQALYLGCLPVTRRCNALKAFEGMGGIFVDTWDEINSRSLFLSKVKIALDDYQSKRFYFDYWYKLITGIIKNKHY